MKAISKSGFLFLVLLIILLGGLVDAQANAATAILQVSKRTLFRMIQKKEVPAFKVGGQWSIRQSQLRKWVERRENPTSKLE